MIKHVANSFIIIDEYNYFKNLYSVNSEYSPNDSFYDIKTQFLKDSQISSQNNASTSKKHKRKQKIDDAPLFLIENTKIVSDVYNTAIPILRTYFCQNLEEKEICNNNQQSRKCVLNAPNFNVYLNQYSFQSILESFDIFSNKNCDKEELYKEIELKSFTIYSNNSDKVSVITDNKIKQSFILPFNSKFIIGDVKIIRHLVYKEIAFDLIVMDPPWPNKTVKRQKTYCMYNDIDELAYLPINELLDKDGLLVIWLTNNKTVHHKIEQILNEDWDLVELTKWHWLKVCNNKGLPICNFCPNHKVPFESILFACKNSAKNKFHQLSKMQNFVFIGIPNASPSRKPPIYLLLDHLKLKKIFKKKLELFARYLLPETLSVGFEVLKFQNLYYFTTK